MMRTIPDPGFAGDDGRPAPEVTSALAAYDAAPGAEQHLATLAVLQDSRVLVPVVAVLGEVEYDEQGLAHDKTSDMAAVLITGRDGRTALLGFTGTQPLQRWAQTQPGSDPRPVPVTLREAARSAIQDEASALLLDLAGPVMFVVDSDDLAALAQGHRLVRDAEGWAWVLG